MQGTLATVKHKNVPQWVGGRAQRVYVGQTIVKTYRFSGQYVEGGGDSRATGLWIVVDNDGGHPIPDWPATYDAAGTNLRLELRTDKPDLVSTALWIDQPPKDNLGCGGNSSRSDLSDQLNHVLVYNGTMEKVYRFTSTSDPSGLWVTTGLGDGQPIPTYPTAIEVGGMNLGVELRTLLGGKVTHAVCWVDVTPEV